MALKFALYGDSYVKRLGAFCNYDMEVPGHVQFFGRGGMAAHRPDDGLLQQLKRFHPDVTVINIGGNDIRHNSTPADIAEDIKKLLTEIQMSGSRVYYCEITERGHFPKDDQLTKKSFNSQRKKVTKLMSRDFNVIPLSTRFPTDYDEDRIHLNDVGLKKMFHSIRRVLLSIKGQ